MLNKLEFALLVLVLLVIFASIIIFLKKITFPSNADTEIWHRLRSWYVMVTLFVFALFLGKYAAIILFAVISFFALREFFNMIQIRLADKWICKLIYVVIPIQYGLIALQNTNMLMFFMPIGILFLLLFFMLINGETLGFLNAVATYYFGLMITVFMLSHSVYLLMLPAINAQQNSLNLLFYLVFLTQFNDILQFVWGKTLGAPQTFLGRKIVPNISPNKTLIGLFGAVVTTTAISYYIAPNLTFFNQSQSIVAGLIMSIGGFIGDIILSAIKRDFGLKNTSQLIPGHGGMLDRIDSLIITAPLFYYYVYYLTH